jgi:hypothetical protein
MIIENPLLYVSHVRYFLNSEFHKNVSNLTEQENQKFMSVLLNNEELFLKVRSKAEGDQKPEFILLENIDEEELELYKNHIHCYFSVQMVIMILSKLNAEELNTFFSLVEENATIFSKVILPTTSSILKYVLSEITEEQIETISEKEFVEKYKLWKQSQT